MEENHIWNFLLNVISIKTFILIVAIYFIIVWLTIIVWVIKDILSRSNSIGLQFFSISTVIIFGPIGALVYLLIRPPKTFLEIHYEEIEKNIKYLTKKILKKINKNKLPSRK